MEEVGENFIEMLMLVQRVFDMGAEEKNPDPAEGYEERAEQGDHDQSGDFVDPVEHPHDPPRRSIPFQPCQALA